MGLNYKKLEEKCEEMEERIIKDDNYIEDLERKIKTAIKMCSQYNFWDKTSMRFTLDKLKKYLES